MACSGSIRGSERGRERSPLGEKSVFRARKLGKKRPAERQLRRKGGGGGEACFTKKSHHGSPVVGEGPPAKKKWGESISGNDLEKTSVVIPVKEIMGFDVRTLGGENLSNRDERGEKTLFPSEGKTSLLERKGKESVFLQMEAGGSTKGAFLYIFEGEKHRCFEAA